MDNNLFCRLFVLSIVCLWASTGRAGYDERPMLINKLPEMGLEIWTEAQPLWRTHTQTHEGQPVFIAETPNNYYPPAAMSWSVMAFEVPTAELEEVFTEAAKKAQQNYGVTTATPVTAKAASYGGLTGLEGSFQGTANQQPVDVLFFLGGQDGKPAVVMQVMTAAGKLPHLKYQIERSWQQMRYLD